MELLAGTLASRLGRPWEARQALEVGMAAAEGLAVMHEHGLLHRDLKPSNIGLAHDGSVKLLDFGIAHLWTSATDLGPLDTPSTGRPVIASSDLDLTSRVLGTPLYCSPERLLGAPATPGGDVWSLAMVLYELLAGQHPWRSDGRVVAPGPITSLDDLRADCSPATARFFARALSPRAHERPGTARELRAGLASLLEAEPRAYVVSA
jgi:serine/threonine protein kinase